MKNRAILTLLAVSVLAACSSPPKSSEQKIILNFKKKEPINSNITVPSITEANTRNPIKALPSSTKVSSVSSGSVRAVPNLNKTNEGQYIATIDRIYTESEQPQVEPMEKVEIEYLPLPAAYRYFEIKPSISRSDRIFVNPETGEINFQLKKGALLDNVKALLAETREGIPQDIVWAVAPHEVSKSYWVKGRNMFEVAQEMVGHYKSPDQMKMGLFEDGTVAVFYNKDRAFESGRNIQ